MATDPNKKTLRHFQCRDYLWETFEQMSAELECSVDYLINEAMRQYARSRSYGSRSGQGSSNTGITIPPGRESVPPLPPSAPVSVPPPAPPPRPTPPTGAGMSAPPLPSRSMVPPPGRPTGIPPVPTAQNAPSPRIPSLPTLPSAKPGAARTGMPAIPPLNRGGAGATSPRAVPGPPPPYPGSASSTSVTLPGSSARAAPAAAPAGPPPMPRSSPPAAHDGSAGLGTNSASLSVIFQGQRFPVGKEEFVIGRGQKTSDLVIRDSNVSRRHAVVVLHNGQYWIVDQQSTNGVEFMGAKIDRKRIDEGDTFKICDFEFTFTYR